MSFSLLNLPIDLIISLKLIEKTSKIGYKTYQSADRLSFFLLIQVIHNLNDASPHSFIAQKLQSKVLFAMSEFSNKRIIGHMIRLFENSDIANSTLPH